MGERHSFCGNAGLNLLARHCSPPASSEFDAAVKPRGLKGALARAFVACCLLALVGVSSGCSSTSTPPIVDASGQAVAGSVATLEPVTLGGVEQWILIRGRSASSPLVLKLHGGPGQAEMATAPLNGLLEQDFLVVEWDQRGAGKSADVSPGTLTMAQIVSDTVELSAFLLKRFHQDRLILVGHSWGSAVGLQAVQRAPGMYRAFVSTGQMTNFPDAVSAGYRTLREQARREGDTALEVELDALGEPPYVGPEGKGKRQKYVGLLDRSRHLWHAESGFDRVRWMLASEEYSWFEKLTFNRAAETSFDALLPDLLKLDLRSLVPRVEVPVYFVAGRHDLMSPPPVAFAYFSRLEAPSKDWVWFEKSAHFPQWEETGPFHALLKRVHQESEGREGLLSRREGALMERTTTPVHGHGKH
jgi:pimeloyl-ACP methyl ester carboxylesterase